MCGVDTRTGERLHVGGCLIGANQFMLRQFYGDKTKELKMMKRNGLGIRLKKNVVRMFRFLISLFVIIDEGV